MDGAFVLLLRLFCFGFSLPDHGDDTGSTAENRSEHSSGADDGMIGGPHNIAAHQITAGDSFVPGGDKEHTENGTDNRQQLQQILAIDGEDKTRRGEQTIESKAYKQTAKQGILPFCRGLFPKGVNQVDDCLHNRYGKQKNAGTDLI